MYKEVNKQSLNVKVKPKVTVVQENKKNDLNDFLSQNSAILTVIHER